MKENIVKNKSFEFALKVMRLNQFLIAEKKEYVIAKQLLRSGTAIGALVRESEYAESKADFIHKLAIALKEANETEYWIELIFCSRIIDAKWYRDLIFDVKELLRLLISIIRSSKQHNIGSRK